MTAPLTRSQVEDLARQRFGTPNARLSRGSELRFGRQGSKSVDLETGQWFDHEADTGGVLRPEWEPPTPSQIWDHGLPLTRGSLAWNYWVEMRCCCLFPGLDLRQHPALHHDRREVPGLVAAVRNTSGAIIAISRTFLGADGSKLGRRFLGPVAGGHVVIHEPGKYAAPDRLLIGEGLESTASAAAERPECLAWSALSAGGVRGLALPRAVKRLTIAPDMDAAGTGQRAVAVLATRARERGIEVEIIAPPSPHSDMNDLHRASRRAPEGPPLDAAYVETTKRIAEAERARGNSPGWPSMTGYRTIDPADLPQPTADEVRRAEETSRRANGHGGEVPRFTVRLWADIGAPVAPDRLVHRLLGTSSFAVLAGPPGSGKSFLALAIALALVTYSEFFGRRVTGGAVLYVSAEGHGGFRNRLIAHRDHLGIDRTLPLGWIEAAPNLGPDGKDAEHVIAAVEHLRQQTGLDVVLVVIDTVNRSLGGGEENSSADMGAFVAACDRIRLATGATVLAVHHTGKDAARGMRGHSSLLGACDSVVTVERIGDSTTRTATVTKQKDGADGATFCFRLESVEIGRDEHGEPITSCVVVPSDDTPPAAQGPKPTPAERLFLTALENAIADHGERRSGRNYPMVALVKAETWKSYAISSGATATATSDSSARALFSKARKSLLAKQIIAEWDGMVWLCATVRNQAQP